MSLSNNKSAIVMPNWIGDFTMALSVVIQKYQNNPGEVCLIVPPALVALCKVLASFEVIPYDRRTTLSRRQTINAIRNKKFSRIIILPRSFSAALFSYQCNIPCRRGIATEWRSLLLTQRLPRSLYNRNHHITSEYAALIDIPCQPPEQWPGRPGIFTPFKNLASQSYIAFCPGAAYGPAKQWAGFESLARLIPSNYSIVILGSEKEKESAERLIGSIGCSAAAIINLAGKTDLVETLSIIAHARFVVANDSGLMHLAGFCGTPSAALFCSTSPTWTRPLGNRTRIYSSSVTCSPCFKRECEHGHYACTRACSAETIMNELKTVLQ